MGHSQNKANIIQPLPLPEADHYVLAFSGGSDSTALLHYLAQCQSTRHKLSAIHINHQIHPDANQWAKQSQSCCQQQNISCLVKVIKTTKKDENSLRQARYKAIAQHLSTLTGTVILLTAHHLNDDVETLLFRLIRGTGLNGLTGMSTVGHFHGLRIFRPMIDTPKTLINQYLIEHKLDWTEDSSNQDTDYDRNYIRHKIIPALSGLRPDAIHRIKDTRDNLSASLQLLEQLIGGSNPLPLNRGLSTDNLATELYHWLVKLKLNPANRSQLLNFAATCLIADADKIPTLQTDSYELMSWQQSVYALHPHLLAIDTHQSHLLTVDTNAFYWQHEFGRLSIHAGQRPNINLQIVFNEQGKRIQQPGRQHHSKVKEILRENGFPPWQRSRLPYVYHKKQLMAVGPIISHHWQQWLVAHNAEYDWQSTNFIL